MTVFTVPPGLWLYPNLFEDVGFFDSFRPVWGWQEVSPPSGLRFHFDEGDGETDLIRWAGQKGKEIQKAEERRKWGEGEC